jgi:mannitol operon repressor
VVTTLACKRTASHYIEMSEDEKGRWVRSPNQEVLKTHPHLNEFLPFLDTLNGESPRGGVLVAASFLENLLHKVLQAFLIEGKAQDQILSGFNAPVGTFSAKIALAAALGLISERERRECDLIRKIRNKFAHNIHPSFDDDEIKSICLELTYRAMPYEGVEVDARGSFTSASVMLICNLTNRPHYVARERLQERDWNI